VHLNSGSELEYPESFNTDQRKVSLTGEAFFEVVKSRKPFEVFINEHKIVVLGTSFNVKTNPETGTIETLVVTGNVTFTESNQNKQNNEIPISEGEKLHFDKTTRQIKKTSVDNYDDIAWKDGILVFKNDAMKDVFSDLEKWYGVSFSISNNQILQCNLTAKFDNESLQEVLDYIDVIMPLKYSFSENNEIILVQGKGCYDFQSSGNN
jgi:ferric-dicitrate binding protein FerR (iron transport regulator)